MISRKHKFIFIHIPKTGGTSIERALNIDPVNLSVDNLTGFLHNFGWLQHCTLQEMELKFNIKLNNFLKFTVIRNPWDRMVSNYFYSKRRDSKKYSTFNEFVFQPKYANQYHQKHDLSQFDFVCDNQGKINIDYFCRFENLQHDFNMICDKLEISRSQLPHTKKTNHKHYTEYYDDQTRQIVAERYAKDIKYFGYEFGL